MQKPSARPSDATPLQRELAAALGALIRAEGLGPGALLRQQDLAHRLGVSRTPLRAALDLLADAGAVTRGPGGVRVVDPHAALPAAASAADPVHEVVVALARARTRDELPAEVMEAELLRRLKVPRGLLRRALDLMATTGLARRRKGFGWRFEPGFASPEDRAAAYRFRAVVEPAALRETGYRIDHAWIEAMRARHCAVLERPWRDADAVAFFEMNAAFHAGIVAGSGNRHFLLATEQQIGLRRLVNYTWRLGPDRVTVSCTEHLGVLEALARGDREEAAERLAAHIRATAALDGGTPSAGGGGDVRPSSG